MKSAGLLVLLSCTTLIGAAEPSKDAAAPQGKPLAADPITAENVLESLREPARPPVQRLTAEDMQRLNIVNAAAAAAAAGIGRNCYYMRVVQPVDPPSSDPRWSEGPTDSPRFMPLQSQSQARVRPLTSNVICTNQGAVRHAGR